MDVLQSFKKTVQRYKLFDKNHKLLLAVSGGADSIALCHICHKLGYSFGIVHLNYQLRGQDSQKDASFVEKTASELNVDFHIRTVNCKEYAKTNDIAIQEAARNIRYDFFETIISMHDYDYVLTAHHAKDNAETMLYTLAKGASLGALRGIPLTRGKIVRPLLHTSKSDLDLYLRRNDILHRHDMSNDDTKYNRNYIRHEILPRFDQINPNLASTLTNTSILGAGYEALLRELLASQKEQFYQSKKLSLEERQNQSSKFTWLYEMIHPLGFNFNDALDIWATLDQKHSTGKTFQHADKLLTIDRGHLILSDLNDLQDYTPVHIDSLDQATKGRYRLIVKVLDSLPAEKGAYFDGSQLVFPLTLRKWQAGDRFRPAGMGGRSKKVKDYLTDQKISGPARSSVEVLVSQEKIVWVVGYRMAHGFKATSESKSIFSISIK